MTPFDDAIAEESGDTGGRGPTSPPPLTSLAETAELFHTADAAGSPDLDINGHRGNLADPRQGFPPLARPPLLRGDRRRTKFEALGSALNVIEAKAHPEAPERQLHIRVGGLNGQLYLDLGDVAWRAVETT